MKNDLQNSLFWLNDEVVRFTCIANEWPTLFDRGCTQKLEAVLDGLLFNKFELTPDSIEADLLRL